MGDLTVEDLGRPGFARGGIPTFLSRERSALTELEAKVEARLKELAAQGVDLGRIALGPVTIDVQRQGMSTGS